MLQDPLPPHSLMLGGCQDMLRWSGQNANQKVGPDKMPTTGKKARTKCQPRLAFCPVGILSGWHFVRLAFCPHTITQVLSCKIYMTGAHHPRGPLFPGQLTGIATWPAGTRPRRRRRPRHERFCGPKLFQPCDFLVWRQTFIFVYGKR